MSRDSKFIELAIIEANKAKDMGEVPVGAVITLQDKVLSTGHNLVINNNDPTAHAEIIAIRNAASLINNYRTDKLSLYVTLEPCAMCYGAIVHARISRLIFGAYDYKTGVCGSSIKLHEQNCFNQTPEIKGGILERECSLILKEFFQEKRN